MCAFLDTICFWRKHPFSGSVQAIVSFRKTQKEEMRSLQEQLDHEFTQTIRTVKQLNSGTKNE